MGISLYGLTPATTYDALIKTGDNEPLTSALKVLSDGLGTNLPMEASTTAINFTGALQQSGVAVPTAGQVAAKQDTLVSGTNIKTINGASVLGSGNIVTPSTPPSGVSGAIQFSNGSAFASDAANLFWDDTNNRLGIGTNAPTATTHIVGSSNTATDYALKVLNLRSQGSLSVTNDGHVQIGDFSGQGYGTFLSFIRPSGSTRATTFNQGNQNLSIQNVNGSVLFQNTPVQIIGSGSTSATTSLLVQNSAGTERFKIQDDGTTTFNGGLTISTNGGKLNSGLTQMQLGTDAARAVITYSNNTSVVSAKYFTGNIGFVVSDSKTYGDASDIALNVTAVLQADSTTRGFLPPRMTTTQKNAIASPATGLVVYDNTTNKLQCYNGSTWNDLF